MLRETPRCGGERLVGQARARCSLVRGRKPQRAGVGASAEGRPESDLVGTKARLVPAMDAALPDSARLAGPTKIGWSGVGWRVERLATRWRAADGEQGWLPPWTRCQTREQLACLPRRIGLGISAGSSAAAVTSTTTPRPLTAASGGRNPSSLRSPPEAKL